MKNGGEVASRGYIFQAIVALIECLDPENDWDEIKNEPKTEEDKVDIMLYKKGRILTAMQVKSSINPFERADAKNWLEALRKDAAKEALGNDVEKEMLRNDALRGSSAKEVRVCLYLVGDFFTPSCEDFIRENSEEIRKIPFEHLQSVSTSKLIEYIRRVGLGDKVRVNDLELIDANLFSNILKNSIAKEPIKRADFEAAFQNAISKGEELAEQVAEKVAEKVSGLVQKGPSIPQCLTPIPFINKEIGLVGREGILGDIRKMLDEESCIVLVNGLGGIGKTAVMQGICNDLKNEGHFVAWISCGDSLQADLLMLRDAFGVPKEEKANEAYGFVKAGLQSLGKGLYLFMDDLSREVDKKERDAINALGVHVMITSRKENLPFPKKKLEYLADQDAIKMFYGYYGGDEEHRYEETVRSIVKSVHSHTLLVELLAKAAKEEGGTLDDFYENLKNEGFFDVSEEELATEHDDENLTIEESVIKLYEIARLSEEQQHIMKLFTVFTPEKEIYYKVREWAGFDGKELKKLVDLGWLERGRLENGYHIHQIVKDSLARQVGEVKLEEYGEFLIKVIDTDGYLGKEVPYKKVKERLVLAEDIARFFDKVPMNDIAVVTLFNNLAGVYQSQGDYGKGLEYYGKAQAICEQVLGTDHLITATTYNNMAGVYVYQGDYGKALEYYGKAMDICEQVLGTEHVNTAKAYNNMAVVYAHQRDYEKALEYYGKALDICEQVLGTDHPDTAATYDNMAGVFRAQGDYGKALEYYGKALAIRERVLGTDHPDTATTYNNMAGVYRVRRDYGKALECYGKALVICERVLGTNHTNTATTYNNIAWVFRAQGEYGKALENFTKAYEIYLASLGKEHPFTQDTALSISIMELLQSTGMTEVELMELLRNDS